MTDQDAAASQAAELLPCRVVGTPCAGWTKGDPIWQCDNCRARPAVAAALRKRDEMVDAAQELCRVYFEIAEKHLPTEEIRRVRDSMLFQRKTERDQARERIAALEADCARMTKAVSEAIVSRDREHVANQRLREALQYYADGGDLRENARAALAGSKLAEKKP